ncbi:sensor histidine kinase [Streptomyces sp. WI04-05B]|uniref:sensor histidine kinase n=1 Tax=Streptomyces TaxID=1883 RepID=UPI0029AAD4F7|nr:MULTISPECIES: sensor histidine kinase [unclassified Streptomyces]MDX2547109.1 sensor histidine kinase [Streptomyces sp. WI04-05B]MDX2581931.1 sensor histidine kinase [Streptomyces sp. WI04-05A]
MFVQRTWSPAVRRVFPQVADIVYAVVSLGIMGAMLHNWPDRQGNWRQTDVWAYVLIALVYLPLALRRRAPLTVLASTAACALCYLTLGYYHPAVFCGMCLAFYTVAARCPRRVAAKCAAASLFVLLWGTRLAKPGIGQQSVVFVTVTVAVLWVTGDRSRRLAERGERLAVLSEQLRLEQEEKAQRAVMAERMNIARELHDVVAHHVSAISVQTGLADYVFTSDSGTARAALETISGSAQEAMAEMRRMLVVLREGTERAREEEGGEHSAAPGLGRLDELARRVEAAGVSVDVRITGAPFALPPGVDLCVFRVVQEALTNVMKHAPAANASVVVHFDEAAVRVRVADDGQAVPVATTVGPTGHGLIGMRERAGIYGGTVTAGPGPQGGFEVVLMVPVSRDR